VSRKTPHHRKLGIWSALPPYLGGKRRLCPLIFREVDRLLPRRDWPDCTFLDGFLGGGSVSLYAKAQGFRVVSTDIASRSIAVGDALIGNSRVRLTREEILKLAADPGGPAAAIETRFAPGTFTKEQARFFDRTLAAADQTADRARAALYRMLVIRVALLAHPMSQVRAGTIHRLETGEYESITESCLGQYVDGMRLTRSDRLWEMSQHINRGVFAGEATVLQRSVLEALPSIPADVAYFDPPYPGVMSYEKSYRVLDEMLEGTTRATSPFTAKDGAAMIDGLFERALHVPIWLLSLGNAMVSIDELESKMSRLGRTTKAIEIDYQHLPAVATEEKKATNKEFLVVGWDEAAVERLLAREPSHHARRIDLDHLATALIEHDEHGRGATLSAAGTMSQEGTQQDHAPLREEGIVGQWKAIAVDEGQRDDPDAVRSEVRSAVKREGGICG
jgi:adenine-specific DNA methylase